jgi:prephenate dehydratase
LAYDVGEFMVSIIAYLGPAGTFTELAARHYDSEATLIPHSSFRLVYDSVNFDCDLAVLPIENSLNGSVVDTLDLLIHDASLIICDEVIIKIDHHFIIDPNTDVNNVKYIYSHPQALAQCKVFIEANFSQANLIASLSTASAVEQIKGDSNGAAIGNLGSAELYGMKVSHMGIQDNSTNVTRFVILGKDATDSTGFDKTSLCFTYDVDKPGQLYDTLGIFASNDINLIKIESRPSREGLGQYIFLIDFDGHQNDENIKVVMDKLRKQTNDIRVFGSYPKFNKG